MKLSDLFEQEKVDINEFYNEASHRQLKLDINSFEEAIKKRFGRSLFEREILGAFNQIDFESQGFLEKNSFVYSLRAYATKVKQAISESRWQESQKPPPNNGNTAGSRPRTPDTRGRDLTDSKRLGESALRDTTKSGFLPQR